MILHALRPLKERERGLLFVEKAFVSAWTSSRHQVEEGKAADVRLKTCLSAVSREKIGNQGPANDRDLSEALMQ